MAVYRSGHNGVDLKSSVSVKALVGSNPTTAAIWIGGVMVSQRIANPSWMQVQSEFDSRSIRHPHEQCGLIGEIKVESSNPSCSRDKKG